MQQEPIFFIQSWAAVTGGISSLEDWQAWARGEKEIQGELALDLSGVAPLQRRRLTPLSKIFVSLYHSLARQQHDLQVPLILGSLYGELDAASAILQAIHQGEPVSPTKFTHSVHNTAASSLSVLTKNQQPSRSLSAQADPLAAALTDAGALLATGTPQVLVMVGDVRPEGFYAQVCNPLHDYGLLLLLGNAPQQQGLGWPQFDQQAPSPLPDSLNLIRALLHREARWVGAGGTFTLLFLTA